MVINHGRVSMFIIKKHNNITRRKLVKNIEPIEGQPMLNVIGYSSLILNRDIDLVAHADEMTSGYVLRRSDLLDAVQKSMIDYEGFHEMRERMLLYHSKESIEAPTLKQS